MEAISENRDGKLNTAANFAFSEYDFFPRLSVTLIFIIRIYYNLYYKNIEAKICEI